MVFARAPHRKHNTLPFVVNNMSDITNVEIHKGAVFIESEDDREAVSEIPSCGRSKCEHSHYSESASADFEIDGNCLTIRWYCDLCGQWEMYDTVTWGDYTTYYS